MIVIDVAEIEHGFFSAKVGRRTVIPKSRTPFLDAARILVNEGLDPATILQMRNRGTSSLRARAGEAAKLTVVELKGRGVAKFAPWTPFPGARYEQGND